jgi:hypothetical protein
MNIKCHVLDCPNDATVKVTIQPAGLNLHHIPKDYTLSRVICSECHGRWATWASWKIISVGLPFPMDHTVKGTTFKTDTCQCPIGDLLSSGHKPECKEKR